MHLNKVDELNEEITELRLSNAIKDNELNVSNAKI